MRAREAPKLSNDQEIHRQTARQIRHRRARRQGPFRQAPGGAGLGARHRPGAGRRAREERRHHAAGCRLRGLRRRRRGARPAARPAPQGLRRRDQRHARAGQEPVPARLHHRPALSHRARGVRPRARARGDRGLDLPRLHGQRRRRAGGRQRANQQGRTRGHEARGRRQRPRAARQRLGPAGRRRRAARLHRQRDVLRPGQRRSWSTITTASRTRRSSRCA